MENTEKGYKGRNIYILADSQAAINALNNSQVNLQTTLESSLVAGDTGRT